jgi:hypothetical protein
MTNKINMAKSTNEEIFYGKTNYEKKIIIKLNINEIVMAKIIMTKLTMVKLTIVLN